MRAIKILALSLCGLMTLATILPAEQTVVVVLDDSGSMGDRMRTSQGRVQRMQAAKQALLAVLADLPSETQVGVLALNSQVNGSNWVIPLGEGGPAEWSSNIQRIQAEGGTPLGASLRMAADRLLEARQGQAYGTYRLLVVTDGEANDAELVDAYLPQILGRGIVTDVIGVDMKADHSLAKRAHSYRRADDDAALQQAIGEVFAETSIDDQNAAEDFQLIAGLPDGFAEQALQALAKVNNEPLQDLGGGSLNNVSSSPGTSVSGSSGNVSVSFSGILGSLICCFGSFFVVAILAVIILGNRSNRRR